MKILDTLIPPPLVAVLFGLLIWLLAKFTAHIPIDPLWRMAMSALFIVCGFIIDISAIIAFRRCHTTINPLRPKNASTLVQLGVYKYSRNPMYLGLVLFLCALTIYLAAPFTIVCVFGFMLFLQQFQILPEERAMTQLFGDEYLHYKSKVRRWL